MRPRRKRKLAGRSALVVLIVLAIVTGSLAGLTLVYSVDLPQITQLEQYRPSTTTTLLDRKGREIGSFALERREVVNYDGFAPVLKQAVLSIEDKDFDSHWGINVLRIGGALLHDLRSHGRAQGASTLTMQLARNLFLSPERTASRKVQEAYLAIQIERTFTKQQIFTLYGNQIYLGSGMYGFEAASEYFFSKHARDLSLTEAALLAGLPKGPAAYSPLLNPEKALRRRNLVLSEMEQDRKISPEQAEQARSAPLGLRLTQPQSMVAPWFQEEIRRELEKQFGTEQVHEAGLRVDTTLDLDLQKVANQAVGDGIAAYERRHGWKNRLENVLASGETIEHFRHPDWAIQSGPGDYIHAVVTRVLPNQVEARIGPLNHPDVGVVLLPEDWKWTGQVKADAFLKPGDIVYIHLGAPLAGGLHRATLEQDSGAQGALMAMDNTSGDVLAMVGGRDFALSQFNRAIQAQRQTGSSFKPYVYTAAIENGAKPTDTIVDSPVNYGGWAPHNYENDFKGAMPLITAFAESRNVPAVKLAAQVGIHKVIDLVHRFGVTSDIPAYLPVALGAAEITLEEQVASYSVFPNDGLRVTPRLIRKVENADGISLWEAKPEVKEVVSQDTARSMMTLLQAVTAHGTGAAAASLNHPLGGKTGTTSDYTDAWFLGFSPSVTCGVWVGFDSRQSLGEKETGSRAALPIWMTWMKAAIASKPDEKFPADQPQGPQATPTAQANSAAQPQKPGQQPTTNAAQKTTPNSTAKLGAKPTQPPAKSPSSAAAKNAKAAAKPTSSDAQKLPLKPASATGAGAHPAEKSPAAQSPSANPRVKPALPPQPAAIRKQPAVKPALDQ
jgi:penicillin-binding protein 1A